MRSKSIAQMWRAYPARECRQIAARLAAPDGSRCPRCNEILEARPTCATILECRDCKRFYPLANQTPEIMYFMRIQRLATAILAV